MKSEAFSILKLVIFMLGSALLANVLNSLGPLFFWAGAVFTFTTVCFSIVIIYLLVTYGR